MTSEPITIRKAAATDIPAIAALQLRSMQALGGAYYPAQVLAGFLGRFGTMAPATKPAGEAGRGAGIGAELSSAVLSATLLAATAFLLRSCLLGGPIIDMQL